MTMIPFKKILFRTFASLMLTVSVSCNILDEGVNDVNIQEQPHNIRSVPQTRYMINCTGLWVKGYIVGGNLSNKSVKFEGPFTAATNLAIASFPTCTERDSCLSVQLPQGAIRDSLNLVTNPHLLGKMIIIKGNIYASYFGLVGIKEVVAYHFPTPDEVGYDELSLTQTCGSHLEVDWQRLPVRWR